MSLAEALAVVAAERAKRAGRVTQTAPTIPTDSLAAFWRGRQPLAQRDDGGTTIRHDAFRVEHPTHG